MVIRHESRVDTPPYRPRPQPTRRRLPTRRVLRSRRAILFAVGAGAVATAGLGSTAFLLFRDESIPSSPTDRSGSPWDLGSFADRDASYVQAFGGSVDLGASGLADSPAKAAAAAGAATPRFPTPLSRDPALHLLRRTTFGPTAPDLAEVRREGIDTWIERQLSPDLVPDDSMERALTTFPTINMSTAELRRSLEDGSYDAMYELGQATLARQLWSHRQLYEVMVDFWANHLNITNPLDGGWDNRSVYDREVIRRHALGRFNEMLLASARSPAMLRYLDNASSDRRNVNENYGRELLELHSVGIEGGYTEADVRQSAYIMTGRTVNDDGEFEYRARRHWTGKVKVLAFTHDNKSGPQGLAVGDTYVNYLARHPATAKHIGRKLAVRFVADNPPASLVDRLAQAYLDNGTAIVPVLRVLFRSLEFWIANGLKTRRPLENFVAAGRALGISPGPDIPSAMRELYYSTERLGQAPLQWGPPNGYPDVAGAWNSAHAMLGIWNSHRALVQGYHKGVMYTKPEYFASPRPATMGPYLDALAKRLVFEPLGAREKNAMLAFLGMKDATKVPNGTLGGKVQHLVPLVLDSVYHALR
jgi:uncharacterized protein (DUF1800 family)